MHAHVESKLTIESMRNAIENFLHVYTMPLVVPWSENVAERLFHDGLEYFFFFFHTYNFAIFR